MKASRAVPLDTWTGFIKTSLLPFTPRFEIKSGLCLSLELTRSLKKGKSSPDMIRYFRTFEVTGGRITSLVGIKVRLAFTISMG